MSIIVQPSGVEEARILLPSKVLADDEIRPIEANELVHGLNNLPLIITQAPQFLDSAAITIVGYISLLRAGKLDTFDLEATLTIQLVAMISSFPFLRRGRYLSI